MGIALRYTKWGGKPHWQMAVEPVGVDRYGWWFGLPVGTPMRRGRAEPIPQEQHSVILVPGGGDWIATWNGPGETDIAVYVDVTTRPSVEHDVISAVDLDLDVVRHRDGSVRVLDEDEFAEHQVRYGYPPEVIASASATAADLVTALSQRREPFGAAGADRLDRYLTSR